MLQSGTWTRSGRGQNCRQQPPESQDSVLSFIFFPAFSMEGAVGSTGKEFPGSPSWVEVVRGGGGSCPPHPGRAGSGASRRQPGSLRPPPRPMSDGQGHNSSWSPAVALAGSPGGSATSVLQTGCKVWGPWLPWKCWRAEGAGQTRATLTPGPGADATQPSWVWAGCPPHGPLHVGQGSSWGQAPRAKHSLFTSFGPGRWRTPRRTARAWGLAAWGPG